MNAKAKKHSLIALLALTFTSVSCSDSNTEGIEEDNLIRINALFPGQSRTTETAFESGDNIGVFVTAHEAALQPYGNAVNNGQFNFDGSGWTSARKYYWNEGSHDVYAYYPFCQSVTDTQDFKFEVRDDQSEHAGYTASDFLCSRSLDVKASNTAVSLQFSHVLSHAVVVIEKGESYEGDLPDDIKVFLHNTVGTANVNLAKGSTVKDPYAEAKTIRMKKISTDMFEAIVVPQRIDSRRPIVEIVMGRISYLMEGTISFRQGFTHTIKVKVTENPEKAEIEIGGGIGGWN